MRMRTVILFVVVFIFGLAYGVLIGKYSVFPYSLIKQLQDVMNPSAGDLAIHPEYYSIVLDQYKQQNLDELVKINTLEDAERIRTRAVQIIFEDDQLPATLPNRIIDTTDVRYEGLENLGGIKKFTVNMNYQINSIGYIFNPVKSNNRLLLYHQGHAGDFVVGINTISYYLSQGYTVYAFCMPLLGLNNNPVVELKIGKVRLRDHNQMQFLEKPISFFIQPVVSMINYAEKNHEYDDITMIGISGGGWTTLLSGAMDTRIDHSISVAGSYPLYIRFSDIIDWGDYEQIMPELYSEIDYLDIYILCATGANSNRKLTNAYNKYDPCCFGGEKFKHYQDKIHDKVTELGGEFQLVFDTKNKSHSISQFVLDEVNK